MRLVVADLDGTLLDQDGNVPDGLWPLLERMRERGIVLAPASGRQYATLARLFGRACDGMPFIAENGAYVVRDGAELSSAALDRGFVVAVIGRLRELARGGRDLGVVLCGKRCAYVERGDEPFLAETRQYYAARTVVDDVLAVEDDVIKIAVFDFGDADSGTAPALARFRDPHQVVVSGKHWIDIMAAGVNKGAAVRGCSASWGLPGSRPPRSATTSTTWSCWTPPAPLVRDGERSSRSARPGARHRAP